MTKREYIDYLKQQITHAGFYDGWCVQGFKKELKKLEEISNAKRIKDQ
mgnify:CR=1 FL=1|tara:strand:- start:343 stop:486 length:144 start_codon:yes stop_codon:yes gene_type:complete